MKKTVIQLRHTIRDTIAGLYSFSMVRIRNYIKNGQFFESRELESINTSLARVDLDSDPHPALILERCFEAVEEFFEDIISSVLEDDSDISLEVKNGAMNAIIEARQRVVLDFQENLNEAIEQRDREELIDVFEDFFGIEDINAILCLEDTSSTDVNIHPLCGSRDLVIRLQELSNLNRFINWWGWQDWLRGIGAGGILEGLANGINNYLPQVPIMIQNTIISEIEKKIDLDNIYNTIYSEARGQAKQKIFKDRATLPGVELSNVKMERGVNDRILFTVDESSTLVTNGLTLGTAMSALAERLQQVEIYEKNTYDDSKNYQLLFSLFNKSLSMVGHYQFLNVNGDEKTYEETIPTSFFRPLHITANQTKEDSVNPYNYYGDEDDGKTQAGYFAIPERLVLEKGEAFTVDLEATQQEGNMLSTVVSQAEMIRGASKILGYLRLDRLGTYDETMGALNLGSGSGDQGEDEASANGINETLFPKSSFF